MDKKMDNGTLYRRLKAVLFGVLLGEVATILLLLISSFLMLNIDLPLFLADVLVVVAAAAGGFISGYASARLAKEKGLLFGALCGGVQILILLLFSLGVQPETTPLMLVLKFGLLLVCAMVGGILGVNQKGKRIKY